MKTIGEYLSKLLVIVLFYILAIAFVPKLYIGLYTSLVLVLILHRTLILLDTQWNNEEI